MTAKLKIADLFAAAAAVLLLVASLLGQFGGSGAPNAWSGLAVNELIVVDLLGIVVAGASIGANTGRLPERFPWAAWTTGVSSVVLLAAVFNAVAFSKTLTLFSSAIQNGSPGLGAGVYLSIAAAVVLWISVALARSVRFLSLPVASATSSRRAATGAPGETGTPGAPYPGVPFGLPSGFGPPARSEGGGFDPTPDGPGQPPAPGAPGTEATAAGVAAPESPAPESPAPESPAPESPAPTPGADLGPDPAEPTLVATRGQPTTSFPPPPAPPGDGTTSYAPSSAREEPTATLAPTPPDVASTAGPSTAGPSPAGAPGAGPTGAGSPAPGAPVAPAPDPAPFSPFWAAVPTPRPIYGHDGPSTVVGMLQPGTWYAAVAPHSHGIIVQLPTGQTGVLVEVADLFRG